MSLDFSSLHISRTAEIVHGVSLTIGAGELHVLLGRNGSGKTTLLNAVMGHPAYTVEKGSVTIDGEDVTLLPAFERARRGLFLSLQQPPEIPGVGLADFLRSATTAIRGEHPKTVAFASALGANLAQLRLDPHFAERSVNVGASGGEKKRGEMVQMLTLAPKFALLDEPDSGLDADALHYVAEAIALLRTQGAGFLIVTHYQAFIELLKPDAIHVMRNGVIAQSGGLEILANGLAAVL